ncbi:MAG: hypothetical protein CDV28_12618 [Candidatus Electronema aureum]|uniref:DUF2142 domain-containing protein n=1 Tax=Candidatus Electronema aureum TaxID=2005002 RepID=A0A521G0B4_9BACT|nr:MAG: hypothetical protein CDV28_12618 [Candidatus Electronema aureum]
MQLLNLFPRFSTAPPLHGVGSGVAVSHDEASPPKYWLFVLLLFFVLSAGYYFFIFNRTLVELELETDTRTILQVFWPDKHGNYSERKSAQLLIKPGVSRYAISVTNVFHLDRLRLDPSENKAATITIRLITLQQSGFPLYQVQSPADFATRLRVIAGVKSMTPLPEGGVSMAVHKGDSQVELSLPKMERHVPWFDEFEHELGILFLAVGCYLLTRLFFNQLNFIPVLATFVLALILVMATLSAYNTHPDENMHIASAGYYKDHFLPPRVGDPAITHTYSAYGVSRLHSGEIYYLIVGKYLHFIEPLHLEQYSAQRLFNVLLFLVLVLYAFGKADFRFFLLSLLISPQIWYVFSYCNSEALSVCLCLFAAYQLATERSTLNTLLRDELKKYGWFASLWLGLLLGLLLFQKQNFYFLYVFFFLYFLWRIRVAPPVWSKRTLARFTAIVLIGGLFFTVVKVTDAWINDFKKSELILAAREQYAQPIYKPNTPLNEKHFYLQMRDRGKTFKQFIELDRWGEKSFRSAFGVYGFTQYAASFAYYDYVRVVGLLLLLTLAVSLVWRGGLPGLTLLGLATGCTLFFLGGMIWHAWTVDFQAQGRYSLPLLPMFAILYYHCSRIVIKPVFHSLVLLLFLLSVYNFVVIGLCEIGKVVL